MKYRELAGTHEQLSTIGLGCMGMSFAYGPSNENDNLATLERALDLGINFLDTADMYANGENEKLISKILVPNRKKIFIATKFGFRSKDGTAGFSGTPSTYVDGSPKWIKQAVENSLKRLNIDTIDLYYAHRIDPNVPVEETVGAMADLVLEGKVRYLGLCEASSATIRKAYATHPIAALQTEYSLISRDVEGNILKTVRELGITLVPYSPLGRGIFANIHQPETLTADDYRRTTPRFQAAYLENNQKLTKALSEFAEKKNVKVTQLALAWVLAQGNDIIPIPGTKQIKYLEENVAATAIELTQEDLIAIDSILKSYPNTGDRYSEGAMKLVNK